MGRLRGQSSTPKLKGVADIVFCFDVTGSMQPCIDGVKENIKHFVAGLRSGNRPVSDWKALAVGYRDVGDDAADPFEGFGNGFVADEGELFSQIDVLRARGGGDEAESLLDALYKVATDISWPREMSAAHRAVIVFTDAPAKTEMELSTVSGDRTVSTVVDLLTGKKIQPLIFGPQDATMELLANVPHGLYSPMGDSRDEVIAGLQSAGFDEVLKELGRTVSQASAEVLDAGSGTNPAAG